MQVLDITTKKSLKLAKQNLVKTERLAEQYRDLLKRHQEHNEAYLRKRHFNSPLVKRIEELENEAEQLHLKIDMLKKNGSFGEISLELIEQVCIKYRLRFLPSEQFALPIPVQAPTAIKEFEANVLSEYNNSPVKIRYHLLAPKGCFVLRPKEKVIDPLIVAEVTPHHELILPLYDSERYNKNSKFYRVYFWGKMFTPWRRFLGLFSEFNLYIKRAVSAISLIPIIVHLITGTPLIHTSLVRDPNLVTFALTMFAIIVSMAAAIGLHTIDESSDWDSPFK